MLEQKFNAAVLEVAEIICILYWPTLPLQFLSA